MDKFYAVYNTEQDTFTGLMNLADAKSVASELNAAMKPEFQNYTVVTVIFDSEV